MTPVRIQRKRTKGWKMPRNTVYVGHPTKWANPWTIDGVRKWLRSVNVPETYSRDERAENCVYNYRLWMEKGLPITHDKLRSSLFSQFHEIKGKNLACWCRIDRPCHADVLLKLANMKP